MKKMLWVAMAVASISGMAAEECTSGKSCYERGTLEQSKGHHDKAIELYRMGCDRKFAESCNKLGFMMAVIKDQPIVAQKFFQLSCEMGYGGGCNNMADSAKRAGDRKTALKFYDLGCRKGYERSCGERELLKNATN